MTTTPQSGRLRHAPARPRAVDRGGLQRAANRCRLPNRGPFPGGRITRVRGSLCPISRIAWRLTRGRRLPLADGPVLTFIAKTTHWGLYALVTAMVIVGMALAWTRGDSIFTLFTLPAFDPSNHALADQVQEIHATIGWIIVVVVGLHATAALFHRLVWNDGVLGRMLPAGRTRSVDRSRIQ